MIHHISIAAYNPKHVAEVLAKLWRGKAFPFPVSQGSYMAGALDENGTFIDVHPWEIELIPGNDDQPHIQFYKNPIPRRFTPFHAAISVPVSQEEIVEIAEQEGWRVLHHCGIFEVIELWIENHHLIELITPSMVSQYLAYYSKTNIERNLERLLAEPARI
jgi:hypothetical protein